MENSKDPRGWYTRGYLPHFDAGPNRTQFITIRLHDSLPQSVLAHIKQELKLRKPENISRETFLLAERFLDKGCGACFLKRRDIAIIVRDTLLRFHEVRYRLYTWVIMPNHVHLLMRALEGFSLDRIMHSIKSYSALAANRELGRSGFFWMRESFDRYIRDEEHFGRAFRYIENNPVKAKLCGKPEEWEFSSAWERRQLAGTAGKNGLS
jgi:putative transposase